MADLVNHPPHYTSHPSGVECIDVIETLGCSVANAIKYLWRTDHKNGLEDLQKARWYAERELDRRREDQRAVGFHTEKSDDALEAWREREPLGPRRNAITTLYDSVAYQERGHVMVASALYDISDLISEEVKDRAWNA